MMDWVQKSHCHWDCGDFRIVKEYCPRRGGTVFKAFDGKQITYHQTLDEAKSAVLSEAMSHV
jgi:hypothetical protein